MLKMKTKREVLFPFNIHVILLRKKAYLKYTEIIAIK